LAELVSLATRCGLSDLALTRLALAHTHTQPRGRVGVPPLVLGRHNYSQVLCCSFFASVVTRRLGLLAFRCFSSPSNVSRPGLVERFSLLLAWSLAREWQSPTLHAQKSFVRANRPLSKISTNFVLRNFSQFCFLGFSKFRHRSLSLSLMGACQFSGVDF